MAITTILAGCDLSSSSDQALDRAIAIAELHRAKLLLVHAQADDAPLAGIDHAMLEQLGEVSAAVRIEDARQLADRLVAIEARGIRAELVSRIGPPDEILAGTALEHAAELIVVGTHGHTGIARFLMGSVASSTIRHAPCDVLVVRGRSAKAAFERPLVATDFTPAASKAISHATWVCAPGTAIDALHAWHLPTGSWGATLLGQARFPWSEVRDAVVTSATARADRLVAEHAALGTAVRVALVQGPPTHAITHAAEDGHHDLIVVGSHGHRGVRRWLLGSVADATVRHAACSVLVVYSGA